MKQFISALPAPFHWHPRLWGHEGAGLLADKDRQPSADLEACADEAARFIIERAAERPGTLSLVAIGPLTNVARALLLEPRLAAWLLEIVLMGGMVDSERVPWPPVLETNLNADPGAAEIVFGADVPRTIVPFEVTTQVFLSPEDRAQIRSWDRPLSGALVDLMEGMLDGFDDFSASMNLPVDIFAQQRTYMHDPLAVYTAMAIRYVTLQRSHLALEVRDRVLRTIQYPERAPNCRVCVGVDAPEFIRFWLDRVRALCA